MFLEFSPPFFYKITKDWAEFCQWPQRILPRMIILNLHIYDFYTSNNYTITHRPPLLETNDQANESAHWFCCILCWEKQRFVIKMKLWAHSLPLVPEIAYVSQRCLKSTVKLKALELCARGKPVAAIHTSNLFWSFSETVTFYLRIPI